MEFSKIVNSSASIPFWSKVKTLEVNRQFEFEPNYTTKMAFEFNNFFDALEWRNKQEYVNIILICGVTGSGKSNVTLQIATEMAKRLRTKFNLVSHTLLGRNVDLSLELLSTTYQENTYLCVEEAELVINRLTAQSIQNRETKQTLSTIRDAKINFIFNAPHLNELDNHVINNQVDWLITCFWNDKKNKLVNAVVEFNARDKKLTIQQFVEHSEIKFKYISTRFYNLYRKEVKNKVYDFEHRIYDFKHTQKKNIKQAKELAEAENIKLFIDYCKQAKKRKENKKGVAIQGFLKDISQSSINQLMKEYFGSGFSNNVMKSLSDKALLIKSKILTIDEVLNERERKKSRVI